MAKWAGELKFSSLPLVEEILTSDTTDTNRNGIFQFQTDWKLRPLGLRTAASKPLDDDSVHLYIQSVTHHI